jgi:carbamoyltransferase
MVESGGSMIILGLKITHDGAIALIDNGRLVFCHEMEKINNSRRFSEFNLDFAGIQNILSSYGYSIDGIDRIAIDGWGHTDNLEPKRFQLPVNLGSGQFDLQFADYGLLVKNENMLREEQFDLGQAGLVYNSYTHIGGHIFSSYCTSPFAKEGKPSFIGVWDGPTSPQMFYYDPGSGKIENLGFLFPITGFGYTIFALNYEPFAGYSNPEDMYNLSIAGKVMAYIALGEVREDILAAFHDIYEKQLEESGGNFLSSSAIGAFTKVLLDKFIAHGRVMNCSPPDMMALYHCFLRDMLIKSLERMLNKYPGYEKNFCFSGGCALNIKWNSAIRRSGVVDDIWVMPFPNDSGSAIGTACCEMVNREGINYLDWDVYQGPPLLKKESGNGKWKKRPCSIKELAALLHNEAEPVVFLNKNAEIGPRALGNRSIIAPAVSIAMKDLLNKVKQREDYRPVAPICIEEDAPKVFNPGVPDPYMLFEHRFKEDWKDRVPAVCHLDGTSRLQTINKKQNSDIYELLSEYKKLSGIPLLCNTSANLKGCGFFPDIKSAQEWDKVNYVWNDNTIYYRENSSKEKL